MKSKNKLAIETIIIVLIFVGLVVLFNALSWTVITHSDDAITVIASKSVINGNILLNGWILPADSYIFTDMPFFVVGILLIGFSPSLMHIVPAVTYALIIIIGAYVASQNIESSKKWFVKASTIIALSVIIGPWNAWLYLHSPAHIGTVLFILISLLLLKSRNELGEITSYFFMGFAIISDPLAIVIGPVPILFSIIYKKIKKHKDENWVNSKLALKIIVTLTTAEIIHHLIPIIGGFSYTAGFDTNSLLIEVFKFPTFTEIIKIIQFQIQTIPTLFGAYFIGQPIDFVGMGYLIRIILVIFLLYAIWKWISNKSFSLINSVMMLGILLDIISFMFYFTGNLLSRYLLTIPIFGIVLITRSFGEHKLTRHSILGLGIIFALIVITWIPSITLSPVDSGPAVGNWLLEHNLYSGYGSYWNSHIITIWTEGKVSIAPVAFDGKKNTLVPFRHDTNMKWYENIQDPPRTFLIFDDSGWAGVDEHAGVATWGEPSSINKVYGKTILVWDHPISIP